MSDTNRTSLLHHAEYDSLLAINDRLLSNAGTCIMYGLLPSANLVDNLCERYDFSCEKCLQAWLSQPYSGWCKRLEHSPKRSDAESCGRNCGKHADEEDIMLCAVRYALGRRTYIVGLVCEYVVPMIPILSDRALTVLERDIREHGGFPLPDDKVDDDGFVIKHYGDECDFVEWKTLYRRVCEECDRRCLKHP